MDIERQLIDHVKKGLKDRKTALSADTSLIGSGLLDSLDILGLIEFVEASFSLKLDNKDMDPENFETVSLIAGLVRRKTGGQ